MKNDLLYKMALSDIKREFGLGTMCWPSNIFFKPYMPVVLVGILAVRQLIKG